MRLKITPLKAGEPLEVNSLLSAGFETKEPQVLVPVRVAELLKILPKLPEGTEIKPYGTAGGITKMYVVPKAVEVQYW
jgi:hypothetical protein